MEDILGMSDSVILEFWHVWLLTGIIIIGAMQIWSVVQPTKKSAETAAWRERMEHTLKSLDKTATHIDRKLHELDERLDKHDIRLSVIESKLRKH